MKIVKLTAANFKKLVAVEITPKGNIILLTGKNGAGKSSVLDAIMAAFCGKKYTPEKPIREGEDHAEIVVETENYIIKRTFTGAGGGSVTVSNAEGMKASSPQALLDKLVGEIAFDPMKFINEYDARKQKEILMQLVGLDFKDLDNDLATIKQKRSEVRSLKETYEHEAARITVPEQTPDEEISLVDLSGEMQNALQHNAKQTRILETIDEIENDIKKMNETLSDEESLIAKLEEQLKKTKINHQNNLSRKEGLREDKAKWEKDIEDGIDLEPIQQRMETLEKVNVHVRSKKSKAEWFSKSADKSKEFSELGKQLKALEDSKAKRLAQVKMPIEWLSIDENGVTYKEEPLAQASDAEKLQIGVAIGMALNPKLRVIRMKGNDLDSNSLEIVSNMVKAKDYQVWIEKVSDDKNNTVGFIIENGSIVPADTEADNKTLFESK